MKTLTNKTKYLKNPHFCPVCGSTDITADKWDGECQDLTVFCEKGHEWREIFKMVGVELV